MTPSRLAFFGFVLGTLAACGVTELLEDYEDSATMGGQSSSTNRGGTIAEGGSHSSGGSLGPAGVPGSGGTVAQGGLDSSGGALEYGGSPAMGGGVGYGGASTSGGTVSTGGTMSNGGSASCQRGQSILVGYVVNARDLGGTPLQNGKAVACGALYRGSPLAVLSEPGCAAFAALGIRTVIDLRIPSERDVNPDSACILNTASMLLAPLPVPYNVSPADYVADLNTTDSIAAAFHALGDEAAYPVYFHCTWGRDRTGVLGAVILLALGASREDIMTEYLLSANVVGAYPNSLTAVLDEIALRGGVEAYLAAAGVTDEQIAVLRARAVAP